MVRLLSDIRHAAHCSTLRAAATNRDIALASAERDGGLGESHERDERDERDESADATREVRENKPARSGS
jgi:hypothetical protein